VGHKVNPIGFRTGIYRNWDARWFARKTDNHASGGHSGYAQHFFEDIKMRKFIAREFSDAEVARIEIEKTPDHVRVIIHAARPGVIIGKKGQEIENLRKKLCSFLNRTSVEVSVQEVRHPELDAILVAQDIARQIEQRASYKRAMKKAATAALKGGARGVKIRVSGRIGGAEIARDEWVRIGTTPLHTLRSDIDYSLAQAYTTYGIIGVKVWICRGDYTLNQ
jgi:small subunit ribosomal protein S3